MRAVWIGLYVLASIWIVGMVMSAMGLPAMMFKPAQRVAVPPAGVVAPGAPAAPDQHGGTTAAPAPAAPQAAASHAAMGSTTLVSTAVKANQPLQARTENGAKVFDLEAKPVKWEVLPGTFVDAWAYNGQVPGPLIRVTEGERVRVNLKNSLPEATVIHFHGPNLPNDQDGVPGVTQTPVQPGQSFTYEFTANPSGTFVYQSYYNSAVQKPKGLYGMFVVDPKAGAGTTYQGDPKEGRVAKYDREYFQIVSELEGYFLINGKAFPATEQLTAKVGERVLIRTANLGQAYHPMHMHGQPFNVVATDGYPVQGSPLTKDTLSVAPGERYDLEVLAKNPGTWQFHCEILGHVTNLGQEPGGMLTVFKVE